MELQYVAIPMTEFSPNQLDYLGSDLNKNVFLCACPGSGKTEVIAAKVAKEIGAWDRFPAGMAILSFSRSATAELLDRIMHVRHGNTRTHPHFVGTVDSFILKYIANPHAHNLTGYSGNDGDYSIKLVGEDAVIYHRTTYAIAHEHVAANRYDWDSAAGHFLFRHPSTAKQRELNALKLQPFQIEDLSNAKKRFNKNGFATYRDVENFALKIVNDAQFDKQISLLVERFPYLIIDECQDLSAAQIAIFNRLAAKGMCFHLVGDLDQAIYGFRKCVPEAVSEFIKALRCDEMSLNENYRSGQAIVNLHGKIVQTKKSIGRIDYADATCYLVEYKKCPTEALAKFDALSAGHARSVIVARGHGTLNRLRATPAELGPVQMLATAISIFAQDSAGSLHASLTLFATYLAENCIKIDTLDKNTFFRPSEIESAEVWHHFLSDCLSIFVAEGLSNQMVTWTAWCAAFKKTLPKLSTVHCKHDSCQKVLEQLQAKKHPAPAKQGASQVALTLPKIHQYTSQRRLATIHEVKGETHDVTMLVSSIKPGEQSHWTEWLADPKSEAARFAYVASSRPKSILIWAVKSLVENERVQLMQLGFHINLPKL